MKLPLPNDTLIKFTFDHVRNIIISATVMGSGLYASKLTMQANPSIDFSLCLITSVLGGLLFLLNYLQLWQKAIDSKISKFWAIIATPIYISFGILIYYIVWVEDIENLL